LLFKRPSASWSPASHEVPDHSDCRRGWPLQTGRNLSNVVPSWVLRLQERQRRCSAPHGRLRFRASPPHGLKFARRTSLTFPRFGPHRWRPTCCASQEHAFFCGPPDVENEAALSDALDLPGDGWLRGTGYHESVAGMLDAVTLDRIAPDRPVRIQHRSERMWFLNSLALDELLSRAPPPPGLERTGDGYNGRLFDEDRWLRETLASVPPGFCRNQHPTSALRYHRYHRYVARKNLAVC
jgi:hypothetical protein